MKRALVTGGFGFVGRSFVRRLRADGWHVVVIDNGSMCGVPEEYKSGDNLDWMLVDVREVAVGFGRFMPALDPDEYDLIIHCAAVVGGRLKIDGDPLAVATDLAIDSDFFNWIVKAKNRPKVVYFSSSAVYPIELQHRKWYMTLNEALLDPLKAIRIGIPDMTYGWAKLTGELLAQHAVKTYNADVVVYRPFSGYGEDQSFDYPFPSIIRRVVNRENPIVIWGSGDQCRDFIHIDDVVEAVMQTKDVLAPGDVLNLGSGEATSFVDLVKLASNTLKCWNDKIEGIPFAGVEVPRVQWECDTTKPEGVFYRVADTYKLNQFYKPKVSLEEGIRRVAEHIREKS